MSQRVRGFTLIELMIVVAVVAILAAIAYPSFNEQVRKARRSDALAEAGRMQLALERWRADNPSYASTSGATNYPAPINTAFYTFALNGQTATTYTLTASPQGGQSGDRCGNLTAVAGQKPQWATADCN